MSSLKQYKQLSLLFPAVIVLLLYLPAVRYGFVWDDNLFLYDTPLYRNAESWLAALGQPFILSPNYFRPLPLLTFMAELRLVGLNPALFHLTNILLHTANTTLVVWLTFRLLSPSPEATAALERESGSTYLLAITAGLLYGWHPALIEGVVFISSRFDLLLTFFLLLALVADVQATGKARPLLVGAAFLLAALSKEMAVAFLLVLPLWHWGKRPAPTDWSLKGMARESWQKGDMAVYAAVLLAALAYLGIRMAALGYLLIPTPERVVPVGTFGQHLLLVARSLGEYLRLIFWPFTSLTPIHYGELPLAVGSVSGWVSVTAVIILLVILYKNIRQRPGVVFLTVAGLVALWPVSNILPLELSGGAFVAERFLLFPLVFWLLPGALLAKEWLQTKQDAPASPTHYALPVAAAAAWLFLSMATIQLTLPHWQDDFSLWQWGVAQAPESAVPYTNLSLQYGNRGDHQTALAMAEEAIQRDPSKGDGWNNAGLALFGLNRLAEAEHAFSEAINRQPENSLYWNNLAASLRDQGELGEAERILLDQVLPLSPDLPVAYVNLGIVYLRADRPDLAALALQDAAQLLPPDQVGQAEALYWQSAEPERWLRLGDLLLANEGWEEAIGAYEQAVALGARPMDVRLGISAVLLAQGGWEEAKQLLEQTLTEYGGDARLYYNLGVIAIEAGDVESARNLFSQAALLAPDWELPQAALSDLQ